ncbi:MAG: kinase to dihydroxyacetone kinase [Lawsonibacter sp.]
MLEFKFDTQLLLEGCQVDEDDVSDYIRTHFAGDCLLVAGDVDVMKLHFHTNQPWQVLEYCAGLGDVYDIVIENMQRQENGQKG